MPISLRSTEVPTRFPRCRGLLCAAILIALLSAGALPAQQPGPPSSLTDAVAAFQQGRTAEARQEVDRVLKAEPSNLAALILAGAILDSEKRYNEAEPYYQRALKIAPASPQVLNNVGNHHLASGNARLAREFFLKTVAADPRQPNANLQLARMSVEDRQGRRALTYLSRLGPAENSDTAVMLLRARALSLAGECRQAIALTEKLREAAASDSRLYFPIGMTLAECKSYEQAEQSFSLALAAEPREFDILYNLGLAALRAGHLDRAAGVMETALQDRPEDVDCLAALAQVYLRQERSIDAAALLAKADKVSAGRPDIILLLAQTSAQLKFYDDAAAVYARYLKLKPEDDVALRERGRALALAGRTESARSILEAYVRKHPREASGYYDLAIAQFSGDLNGALVSLDRALALDPKLTDAHLARGELNFEAGREEAALADLRTVLEQRPKDVRALVRMGQIHLNMNRAGEALPLLQQATDLAPRWRAALLPYYKVLEKLGRKQEAQDVLARVKQAGNDLNRPPGRSGLSEFLSLSPAGRRERYLDNLRRSSDAAPRDPRWKLQLGGELLADGKIAEGLAVFRDITSITSDPPMLARAGGILIQFQQYGPARPLLESALAGDVSLHEARLDLATALVHLASPDAALAELDKSPAAGRNGDYYLLRAQVLDSLGRVPEAADALNHGIRTAPTRPDLYFEGAGFLLKHRLYKDALALLEPACRLLPDARELLLAQAVTLIHLNRTDESKKLLARIQTRWPEWERPYLLNGILNELESHSEEARQLLETAIALGANTSGAHYYHAMALTHITPEDYARAQEAIGRALELAPKDPYSHLLAGKIALARNDHAAAIRALLEATRLAPTLIPAHYALVAAYRAAGEEQKSAAEAEEIRRLSQEKPAADQRPFSGDDFLFTVR